MRKMWQTDGMCRLHKKRGGGFEGLKKHGEVMMQLRCEDTKQDGSKKSRPVFVCYKLTEAICHF